MDRGGEQTYLILAVGVCLGFLFKGFCHERESLNCLFVLFVLCIRKVQLFSGFSSVSVRGRLLMYSRVHRAL
jgi:hypothetical protein